MTITDHYRADREACKNKADRSAVWRTYARAFLEEVADRVDQRVGVFWNRECAALGATLRWREARGDEELAVRWLPFWRALSDADMLALEDALIRAREKRS